MVSLKVKVQFQSALVFRVTTLYSTYVVFLKQDDGSFDKYCAVDVCMHRNYMMLLLKTNCEMTTIFLMTMTLQRIRLSCWH